MRLVIDLMQTMNIGGRFKSSTVQNLSACLRGMLVALFAVLSVVTGLCEKQKMTIDGYTFYPVSETEMLGACLEEITNDVIAEARKTGILTIPDFLIEDGEKYYIVDIMARVYYGKGLENVEELILPSECINISEYNFIEMSNLRKVHFGDKLRIIHHNNFCNMPYLEEFALPDSFDAFDEYFLANVGLKEFVLPPKVVMCYGGARGPSIWNLPNLEHLSLGNVETINNSVYDLPLLTTVTIPGTCRRLYSRALSQMPSLKSVTFAKRTATEFNVYSGAFSECPLLTDYYVEDPTPFDANVNNAGDLIIPYSQCTLHVPIGAKEAYSIAPFWSGFGTIVEDAAGVEAVGADDAETVAKWYSVDGREIDPSTYRGIALRRSGSKVTKQVLR